MLVDRKFVTYDTSQWTDKKDDVCEWVLQELIDILMLGIICKLKLSAKLKVSLQL